jgi:uncharacterized integral membrane protein
MVDMAKRSSPEVPEGPPADHKRDVRLVAAGVSAVLLVWFALANRRDVSIDFWVAHRSSPLVVVIAISGLLGALVALAARRRKPPRE